MSSRPPLPPLSFSAWLRYDVVTRLLPEDTGSVLEIGSGSGSMGALLARRFDYVGLEPDPVSHRIAMSRIGPGIVLNTTVEEYAAPEPFDVVCAFEVLEHFEDDHAALESWLRHVRRGGWLLVSVPHGRRKFNAWDEKAGHYRRYDRTDLEAVFASVGLESITIKAYGFPLGSAASLARSAIARLEHSNATMDERTAGSARNLQPPEWASKLTRAVATPFCLVQRPFVSTDLGPGLVGRARLPAV